MKDVFFFDSMLTPKIITLLYWVGLISVVTCGIAAMFGMFGAGFWSGLAILVGGVIGTRLWCELLIVMFKINENLKAIANRQ
jgi:xanthine/uracil permease